MNRRNFITGMAGILAAGYSASVLPSGVIMPVRKLWTPITFKTDVFTAPSSGIYTLYSSILLLEEQMTGVTMHLHTPQATYYSRDTNCLQVVAKLEAGDSVALACESKFPFFSAIKVS